jgi:hypothetical protein
MSFSARKLIDMVRQGEGGKIKPLVVNLKFLVASFFIKCWISFHDFSLSIYHLSVRLIETLFWFFYCYCAGGTM